VLAAAHRQRADARVGDFEHVRQLRRRTPLRAGRLEAAHGVVADAHTYARLVRVRVRARARVRARVSGQGQG